MLQIRFHRDSSYSTIMMKTSLIFKACGLFLAVAGAPAIIPNGGDIEIPTDEPVSILHGEYQVQTSNLENYRPTWASVWKINQHDLENGIFYVSTWPPKYCHAIYVCPITEQSYNQALNFKTTEEDMCEKEYAKFYPHAKKILLKKEGGAEESKFWMKNRLEFEIDKNRQSKLRVLDSEPESHSEFMEESKKGITFGFDLTGKELLILTNSRMCQINKIGGEFYPIFREGVKKTPDNYPKWFDDGSAWNSSLSPTDYLPPVKSRKTPKSIDLLAYLKDKTWTDKKIGNLVKSCEPVVGWRAGGRRKPTNAMFQKVSVGSYTVNFPNTQWSGKAFKRFTLNVEKCHWFRLWFSDKGMEDYKSAPLSEMVDFFLNEGFYISPESDEAHPLPGVNELTKFTFRVAGKDSTLVDMLYGETQGSPIYHDQFNIKDIQKNFFRLHVIKAPGCEISMDSRPLLWTDHSTSRSINMWNFGTCQFTHFE
ncbi:hypothetical protein CRE_26219 [Caenorhabditis remanei]|uniref:Uncharacterized protein n=1 Tax=Caenorhabditis remanei TaxID=31234 RepID=E3LQU0_CAERE|nr:hypothetical protein CRE_26219 [Caenorhabditis remanei]